MKIEILHESQHYVIVKAPKSDDGSYATRADILPILEALRSEHGLRFLSLHSPPTQGPALICERIVVDK